MKNLRLGISVLVVIGHIRQSRLPSNAVGRLSRAGWLITVNGEKDTGMAGKSCF
ncbi:MAG: hypothetical protein MJY64_00045 [archaeon]|nr:hypothetical protein [archaeon]